MWLWARFVFAIATCVVIVAFLGFAEGENVQHGFGIVLAAGPLWLVPIAIDFAATRTLFGVVAVGLGLFLSVFLALRALYDDPSSTAALGIALFPVYFALAVGAYLAVEWAALRFVRRGGPDQLR